MTAYIHTDDLKQVQTQLPNKNWLIACLCAAWCDTCTAYYTAFNQLAAQHPDKCFTWIDIEDCAHLIEDIEIENFPTILIQHLDQVAFLGTMLPDTAQLHRLINSLDDSMKAGPIKRSTLNQAAPESWSLRQRILSE